MAEKKEGEKGYKYLVSITGSNTNFACPINNLADFEDLEEILRVLRKKI